MSLSKQMRDKCCNSSTGMYELIDKVEKMERNIEKVGIAEIEFFREKYNGWDNKKLALNQMSAYVKLMSEMIDDIQTLGVSDGLRQSIQLISLSRDSLAVVIDEFESEFQKS